MSEPQGPHERVDYWGAMVETAPERSPVAFGLLAVADALLAVADALGARSAPAAPTKPPPQAVGTELCLTCDHQRQQHHGNAHQCRLPRCRCIQFELP